MATEVAANESQNTRFIYLGTGTREDNNRLKLKKTTLEDKLHSLNSHKKRYDKFVFIILFVVGLVNFSLIQHQSANFYNYSKITGCYFIVTTTYPDFQPYVNHSTGEICLQPAAVIGGCQIGFPSYAPLALFMFVTLLPTILGVFHYSIITQKLCTISYTDDIGVFKDYLLPDGKVRHVDLCLVIAKEVMVLIRRYLVTILTAFCVAKVLIIIPYMIHYVVFYVETFIYLDMCDQCPPGTEEFLRDVNVTQRGFDVPDKLLCCALNNALINVDISIFNMLDYTVFVADLMVYITVYFIMSVMSKLNPAMHIFLLFDDNDPRLKALSDLLAGYKAYLEN